MVSNCICVELTLLVIFWCCLILAGNFLYDNPKERVKNQLQEKTHSLWYKSDAYKIVHIHTPCMHAHTFRNYLAQLDEAGPMVNPLYEKNSSVMLITVTALNVTLWKRLYLRCDAKSSLTVPNYEAIKLLKDKNAKLKQDLADVRKSVMHSRNFVSNMKSLYLFFYRELEEQQLQGRKFASNWS